MVVSTPLRRIFRAASRSNVRRYSEVDCKGDAARKGLVVGAYDGANEGDYKLTYTGCKFDSLSGGRLSSLIKGSGLKLGNARVFHNLPSEFYAVAVAGLGPEGLGFNEDETLNECKENMRIAAASGALALQDQHVKHIYVDGFGCPEPSAEGASLGTWRFQKYKHPSTRKPVGTLHLYDEPNKDAWKRGMVRGDAQNIARKLEELPANKMTPSKFARSAIEILCPCGVSVEVRDRDWMESHGLTAFVAMCRGCCEPPLLLECAYCGGAEEDKPIIIAGKGVTFDSGGVCLKKCKGMSEYRADMAGAAVTVGVLKAIARLKVPLNVTALIPLCENMPGGCANRPGDLLVSLNSKSIRLKDTSKEGRVMLADALAYSSHYKPCLIMSVATLTEGIRTALGGSASGVFSNSTVVWKEMERAGAETGDRVWRLPMWKYFCHKVTSHMAFDVNNVGSGRGGTPCVAAAFLAQFAPPIDFCHIDITGTGMLSTGLGYPYLRKGKMTGRPVRTITQFLYQMACPDDTSEC